MKLSRIFDKQQEFRDLISKYVQESRPEQTDEKEFQLLVNKLREEVEEVRAEFDNKDNLKEELVDVMKFIINICLLRGISAEEFFQSFMDKSDKNVKRFLDGDWRKRWDKKDQRNEQEFFQ